MGSIVKYFVVVNSAMAIGFFFFFDIRSYLVYSLILTNILAIYQARYIQLSLVAFIYIFTYNLHYYFQYQGAQLSPYTHYQNPYSYGIGMVINLVLLVSFILFLKNDINRRDKLKVFSRINSRVSSNGLFFAAFGICFLIIMYLMTKGVNLFFASGNLYELYKYNLDNIGGVAVYFCIFFLLMFVFKPKQTSKIYVHIIFFLFIFYALSRGTRMLMVPPLLIYFFSAFENKFNWKWIIVLSAAGMAVLTAIDRFKNGIGLFEENTKGSNIIINNQAEILYGANAIITIIQEGIVSFGQRCQLFFGFVLTAVFPPGLFSDAWKYPHFTKIYNANAGGGGLASVGAYTMLGYLGPFLIGLYLALMSNYIYSSRRNNAFFLIFFSMTFFMITRWFTYDLNVMIRLPLYTLMTFQLFLILGGKYNVRL